MEMNPLLLCPSAPTLSYPAFWRRAVLPTVAAALLAGCGGTAPVVVAPGAEANRPAAPAASSPAATSWAGLQAQVGRYPTEGNDYLRTGPLAQRLRGLLGPVNYPVLLDNLGVSGPLRQEGGMLYITGNRPHEGGTEAAAVVIHPAHDAVRVWLLTGGEEWEVQDQGTPKTLPADVAAVMDNARR